MDGYHYKKENDKFVLYDDDEVLLTPVENNVVCTPHEELAKRLVEDINEFGLDYTNGNSLFSWQCTYLDRTVPYGYYIFRQAMENSFLGYPDWTFNSRFLKNKRLVSILGSSSGWNERFYNMHIWLDNLSLMQLTAACCIANAYESLNISYSLATIIHEKIGKERDDAIAEFASLVDKCGFFPELNEFGHLLQDRGILEKWPSPTIRDFKNFELYYSFDLKDIK